MVLVLVLAFACIVVCGIDSWAPVYSVVDGGIVEGVGIGIVSVV